MNYKSILGLLSAFILSGCASTYEYKDEGPSAKLTVPRFNTEYKLLGGFSGGTVRISSKGADGCGQFKNITHNGIGKEDITVDIPSDKDLFVSVERFIGNSACNVVGVFTPEENKSYKVLFGLGGRSCRTSIVENNTNTPTPVKLEHAYASTWNGIKVCRNKSEL